MAMGKRRRRPKQTAMWVATQDVPRHAAHPFYTRLNQILDKAGFDGYVESLCQGFYADEIGRPGLPPGRYFRLLLIGYYSTDVAVRPYRRRPAGENTVSVSPLFGHGRRGAEVIVKCAVRRPPRWTRMSEREANGR